MEQFDKGTLTVEFPKILQNLQGSDAQIEIIQSSVLQTARLSVKGNQSKNPQAYILVQSKLQRGDLKALEYTNAEERAQAAVEFFTDVLEFKPENVVVCRDYTKAQIIELLDQLYSEAEAFENNSNNSSRDANAIFINWIGFMLDP